MTRRRTNSWPNEQGLTGRGKRDRAGLSGRRGDERAKHESETTRGMKDDVVTAILGV